MIYEPYLYDDVFVLRNKFDIKDAKKLKEVENKIVSDRLHTLSKYPIKGKFDFSHMREIHWFLFSPFYDWAGHPREEDIIRHELILNHRSIQYETCKNIEKSSEMILNSMKAVPWNNLTFDQKISEISKYFAELWRIHPFREGNTRTISTFIIQYMEEQGVYISRENFSKNAQMLRDALVYAADKDDSRQPEYLEAIIRWSIDKNNRESEKNRGTGNKSLMDYLDIINIKRKINLIRRIDKNNENIKNKEDVDKIK